MDNTAHNSSLVDGFDQSKMEWNWHISYAYIDYDAGVEYETTCSLGLLNSVYLIYTINSHFLRGIFFFLQKNFSLVSIRLLPVQYLWTLNQDVRLQGTSCKGL